MEKYMEEDGHIDKCSALASILFGNYSKIAYALRAFLSRLCSGNYRLGHKANPL